MRFYRLHSTSRHHDIYIIYMSHRIEVIQVFSLLVWNIINLDFVNKYIIMGECQSACEGDNIIKSQLDQSHVVEYNGQRFLMPEKLSFNRQSTFSRVENAAKVFCQKNNISPFYIPLVSRILAYRNEFVFQEIWNGLNEQQQFSFLQDLNSIEHDLMDSFYFHFVKKMMKNEQISLKKIKMFKPKYTKESEISKIEKHELYKIGVDLIEQNKVAVVLMCAGSSSRFNNKTKFLYPIHLSKKVTIMDLIFKRLRKNCKKKLDPPIIINCNIHNIQQIKTYIHQKKHYGFNPNKFKYVLTNELAVFDRNGKYCLSSKMKLMKRPSGTGSCAQSLIYNKAIYDYLKSEHIEYVYFSGLQNLFENPCDPIMLGLIRTQKRQIAAKCVGSKIISQNLPRYYGKEDKSSSLEYLSNNNITSAIIKNQIFDNLPIAINSIVVEFQSLINVIKDYSSSLFLAEKYHVVLKQEQIYNFRLFKTEVKECVSFEKDIRDIVSCVEHPLLYKASRKEQYAPIFTANHSYSLFQALNFYQETLEAQIAEQII